MAAVAPTLRSPAANGDDADDTNAFTNGCVRCDCMPTAAVLDTRSCFKGRLVVVLRVSGFTASPRPGCGVDGTRTRQLTKLQRLKCALMCCTLIPFIRIFLIVGTALRRWLSLTAVCQCRGLV